MRHATWLPAREATHAEQVPTVRLQQNGGLAVQVQAIAPHRLSRMGMPRSIAKAPLAQYLYRWVQQAGALPTLAAIAAVIVVYLWMVSCSHSAPERAHNTRRHRKIPPSAPGPAISRRPPGAL